MSNVPRVFDILLRTLPQPFREQHREEIVDLITSYTSHRTALWRVSMWVRASLDVLWVALILRWDHLLRGRRGPTDNRDERLWGRFAGSVWQDVQYGVRSLRRDVGLATLATVIVGLGVGASATVFSVVNTLLLRPLPFEDPNELVWISNGEWGKGQQLSELSVQVSHVSDLRTESESFADVAGYHLFDRAGDHTITDNGNAERLTRLRVTANFFPLLGVVPQYGRLFTPDEIERGGTGVVLLDNGFWRRRFGADPGIVGTTVRLNGTAATVIGVLPASFDFESIFAPGNPIDFVVPYPLSAQNNRSGNTLALIARLRDGANLADAQSEANVIAARPRPDRRNSFTPHLTPLRTHVSGPFQSGVFLLACAVGIVMLIVCANLSNLLLARGAFREKELTIRAALGASRGRLVRQMLTESLVLASCGAILGLLLSHGGTRLLAQMSTNIPLLDQVTVDSAVLVFAIVAAVATGLVFGVAPALRMSSLALHGSLKQGARGSSSGIQHSWSRNALVVSEVALACVLLIGAGLLLRSFLRVVDVELGFQPDRAVALRIDPAQRFQSAERRVAFYDEALRRVRAASGVDDAGITDVLPTAFNRRWDVTAGDAELVPFIRIVSEEYLAAMGLHLISGRDFTVDDNASSAPVVLINDEMAVAAWPDRDPLGQTVRMGRQEWEVIGIVKGMRHLTPEQDPGPELFFPFRQMDDFRAAHLIARSSRSTTDLIAAVRGSLTPMDQNLPVNELIPIQDIIDRSLSPRRFTVLLLVGFAGFALVLASLGIYGLISYAVVQRQHEIGIRIALGASASHLQRRVVVDTLKLAGSGLAVGLISGWIFARALQGMLFGVTPSDPITFVVAPLVLLAVAAIAGYIPARRTTQFDPAHVLRREA